MDFKPNCEKCEATFTSSQEFLKHMEEVHTTLNCPYCQYEAMSDKSLREHIKNHQIGAKFICKFCHFITRSMPNLNRHIQYMHTNERKFMCDYCSFSSVEEHKLKTHMRVHSGERPFKCLTCDKTFKHLISLQRHVLSHTDAKHNICILCFQVFKLALTLRNHLKKVHGVDNVHIEGVRKCKEIGLPKTIEWYIKKLGVAKEFVMKKYIDLTFYEIKPIYAIAYTKHFERVSPIIWEAEKRVPHGDAKKAHSVPRGLHTRLFLADLAENEWDKNKICKVAAGFSREQDAAIREISNEENVSASDSENQFFNSPNSNDQKTQDSSQFLGREETVTMEGHNKQAKNSSRVKRAKRNKSDQWTEESPEECSNPDLESDDENDDENDKNVELLLPNKRKRGLMLKKMRAGEFGPHPRVIKVLEDGTIIDTTDNFKEFLPI